MSDCVVRVFDLLSEDAVDTQAMVLVEPLSIRWRGCVVAGCDPHSVMVVAATQVQAERLIQAHVDLVECGGWEPS